MDLGKYLPQKGIKFRLKTGTDSFAKKLSALTRTGSFRNLKDNKEAAVNAFGKVERYIKRNKGLTGHQILKMKRGFNTSGNVTINDKRKFAEIAKFYKKSEKSSIKKNYDAKETPDLSKEQIKRNIAGIRAERAREESGGVKGLNPAGGFALSGQGNGSAVSIDSVERTDLGIKNNEHSVSISSLGEKYGINRFQNNGRVSINSSTGRLNIPKPVSKPGEPKSPPIKLAV